MLPGWKCAYGSSKAQQVILVDGEVALGPTFGNAHPAGRRRRVRLLKGWCSQPAGPRYGR